MASTVKWSCLFSCLYGKKCFFFLFVHCSESLRFQIICDKEFVHLQVQLQRHYSLCNENKYDKYQREEHDTLLSELNESPLMEDYQTSESCFRLSYRKVLHIAKKLGDLTKDILVMAAEENCPCSV